MCPGIWVGQHGVYQSQERQQARPVTSIYIQNIHLHIDLLNGKATECLSFLLKATMATRCSLSFIFPQFVFLFPCF